MRTYECLLIFPPEEKGVSLASAEKKVESLIKKFSGKLIKRTEMGKRMLGYAVRKHKEGQLLLLDVSLSPPHVADFRKALELCEEVIKFTLTLKNPIPEGQAGPPAVESKSGKTAIKS